MVPARCTSPTPAIIASAKLRRAERCWPSPKRFRQWDTAADAVGNVYIADSGSPWIYRVGAGGAVTAVAGGVRSAGGVALDRDGNLYYSDTAAGRVWRLGVSGTVTEVGAGRWLNPRGLTVS